MDVLFVLSGNRKIETIAPFIQVQIDSLSDMGVKVSLFRVVGGGIRGYWHNLWKLRKKIQQDKIRIIHAHYALCGYLAWLAAIGTSCKVVVSLMGNDMKYTHLNHFCAEKVWAKTIVKSQEMAQRLYVNDVVILPNGVDLQQMTLLDKDEAKSICGFRTDRKYIIWCSQIDREEKNFALAQQAVRALNDDCVELVPLQDIKHKDMNVYMCAADILLLSSKHEGSPNVVKEAMACNLPVVSTNVGDVAWLSKGVEGMYIADNQTVNDLCLCLRRALQFGGRTNGREQLIRLGLTSQIVARKLYSIYECL